MSKKEKAAFTATIEIIGINPFVLLPEKALNILFTQAGREKGKIPVRMSIDGHEFPQTLVKYAGYWRLYLNMPMRKAAGKDVGDTAKFEIAFDPADRSITMPSMLEKALKADKVAKTVFDGLPPSRRHEIIRYIATLKTEEAIERNILRAINFLHQKERFIGRDKP